FGDSGLTEWIGTQAEGLGGLPVVLLVVVFAAGIIFLTELTSNTATAATFLPVAGGVALGIGVDPMLLVIPVALAATCAFMLPVATPPKIRRASCTERRQTRAGAEAWKGEAV